MQVALKIANPNIQEALPALQDLPPLHLNNLLRHLALIRYHKHQGFQVQKKALLDNKCQT
jgi:hypothetical protein